MTRPPPRGPADPAGPPDTSRRGPEPAESLEESGGLGPFRSWRALYAAVVVYTAGLIIVLYVFTRLLDHSGP